MLGIDLIQERFEGRSRCHRRVLLGVDRPCAGFGAGIFGIYCQKCVLNHKC
jgi:hypothetical protein